ncbi:MULTISPECIES: hypothetical protein [unclassified Microcoleus]|uniref:hypothetical protein n=1 Tax=unclassified Microcoleus TaxID=2642155 RepID=UPI002FCF1D15
MASILSGVESRSQQTGRAMSVKGAIVDDNKNERWDKASVHEFRGTYGDYVLNKVAKVFPQLRQEVL